MDIREVVREETIKFREIIPKLIKDGFEGKWVVFKNGEVKEILPTEDAASEFALREYGVNGGYVISPISDSKPTPITAGVVYWLQ